MFVRSVVTSVSAGFFASAVLVGCGDDGGGGDASDATGTGGAAPTTATATTGSGPSTTGSSSSGVGAGGDDAAVSSSVSGGGGDGTGGSGSGGAGGAGSGGGGGGGGGDEACPEGYAGPECIDCATGWQDDDADGACLPGCDAEGDLALDCPDHASCAVDSSSGERACLCDPGHVGDDCATCAPGYALDRDTSSCLLDLPDTTGLTLWLDASVTSSLDIDVDAVHSWSDRRSDTPILMSESGARPTWMADVVGGLPVVQFDGDQLLRATGLPALQGSDYVIFAVVGAGTDTGDVVSREHPEFATSARLRRTGTSFEMRHRAPNDALDVATITSVGSSTQLLTAVRSTSDAFDLVRIMARVDGEANGLDSFVPSTAANLGNMGGSFSVGANGFVGTIAEILVYDRAVAFPEIQSIQAYLAAKYDLDPTP